MAPQKKEERKSEIIVGIANVMIFFIHLFFIWFNSSYALKFYAEGQYNIAGIFVAGAILWACFLIRDMIIDIIHELL